MRWFGGLVRGFGDLVRGFANILTAFAPRGTRRHMAPEPWARDAEALRGDAKRLERDWRKVVRW